MSFNPIVAKLLAAENLTVMQANVKTACFNVHTRELLIPILLPKYDGCYGMLTSHEVGHALFTTEAFNDIFIAATNTMRQYYNVCEDVRVEKLIKRKYPGLRRVMAEGYEIFNANNFFLPSNVDVNELTFIDRINSHFKIGHICGVKFTSEELVLVDEVEAAESVNDVIIVSRKIYELAKKELTKPKQKSKKAEANANDEANDESSGGDDTTSDESNDESSGKTVEDSNASSDESDETSNDASRTADNGVDSNEGEEELETPKCKNSNECGSNDDSDSDSGLNEGSSNDDMSPEEIEKALESVTQQALDGGLKEAVDNKSTVKTFSLETKFAANPIYSYKTILKNLTDDKAYNYTNIGEQLRLTAANFESFVESTKRTVAHMVKEFEMKKSAHQLRHSQTAKTGRLDVNKLFAYKIKDELFKSITVTSDEKNHGMIFLVDWSGSMYNHLNDTLQQLMSLAMFCRKAKIPFTALAFTDTIFDENLHNSGKTGTSLLMRSHITIQKNDVLLSGAGYAMQLLELMSDKMNEREFVRMMKLMYSNVLSSSYYLQGTPLNGALIYMHSYVTLYKKMNNIEKLTFVVLTDGAGDSGRYSENGSSRSVTCPGVSMTRIVDPVTKDVYSLNSYSSDVTTKLLTMIGKAAACQVIGFYVCKAHEIAEALRVTYSKFDYSLVESAKSDFKKSGYSIFRDCGYDKLYLVNANSLKSNDYKPKYSDDMSASNLAREMVKRNDAALMNKMLMGRIVSEFSVGLTS